MLTRAFFFSFSDSEIDELEGPTVHYKPEAIETLCQLTKFNKRELQLMYRGFKQECPSGMVKEETFKIIYSQFFPRGADASQYAHFVFNTFDQDHTGAITFTDFVIGLSVLSRGSLQEKLRWTFNLYDINGDGYITKDELARIVKAVYDLMGKAVEPMVEENTTREHVERVFQARHAQQAVPILLAPVPALAFACLAHQGSCWATWVSVLYV
ncbi:hypothetical protein HPB48_015210 [Haemaphysalis longicornis]|uniref:EF-hand domain-containing protein n=1 Tax=Haemaphysalis longicornis TaxID=44386 RepID=A0A9J6FIS2_HAELO|nr:hypothetical protein HPB48_015210 [Haemaphysalis longicornis]